MISADRIARQIAFTLEKKSPEIAMNIFLNNGVLAAVASNGRVKIVRGGNRFDERVHLGSNPNVAFRSPFTQIPTTFPDNWRTAEYGHSTISGATPVNLVEIDQNAGPEKLSDLAESCVESLMETFPNSVADALMASSTGANDPLSIRETIEATAFGSQTSSTGGISRADHTGSTDLTDAWQNQYSATAISDISGAAGKGAIHKFYWTCSPGGSALKESPDVALTTIGVFSKIAGGEDNIRRYGVADKLAKLGFNTININNAAVITDRNCPTGYLYFLNTNYMKFQVLAGPNTKKTGMVKVIGDGAVGIPLQVRPPVEADDYLNYTIKAYMVCNLTFSGLRQHGLQVSITEA